MLVSISSLLTSIFGCFEQQVLLLPFGFLDRRLSCCFPLAYTYCTLSLFHKASVQIDETGSMLDNMNRKFNLQVTQRASLNSCTQIEQCQYILHMQKSLKWKKNILCLYTIRYLKLTWGNLTGFHIHKGLESSLLASLLTNISQPHWLTW